MMVEKDYAYEYDENKKKKDLNILRVKRGVE